MSGKNTDLTDCIRPLYRYDQIRKQAARYEKLIGKFKAQFQQENYDLFSTPGRTEIGGNHTDHNHGRVLAASIDLDMIAVAAPCAAERITLHSQGYAQPFEIDLSSTVKRANEAGTTAALIRGIAAGFSKNGFKTGGFNACIDSQVLPGSGLSSSAAIEVLLATIFNVFYNKNRVAAEMLAKIGQFAENDYFDKPCGLMDQMACAIGGIISIDFARPANPEVKAINVDFDRFDHALLVVNTGGSHADLTAEYAAVPEEMKQVAAALGKNVCRDLTMETLITAISRLRSQLSDRAVLRAYHFLGENERVLDQIRALESGHFERFLELINQSGLSSFRWLQNVYSAKKISEQSLTLALALTEYFLKRTGKGACRVHGGGFAGTILVFLPPDQIDDYVTLMEPVFGAQSVTVLRIRKQGSIKITSGTGTL
jgi:galactokinase